MTDVRRGETWKDMVEEKEYVVETPCLVREGRAWVDGVQLHPPGAKQPRPVHAVKMKDFERQFEKQP